MIRGGSRSPKQNKDLPLDHPGQIIDFKEAKRHLLNPYHECLDYQPKGLRDFPIQFGESPDGIQRKSGLKNKGIDFLMDEKSEKLTNNFIKKNAEYSLESSFHHWIAWIWENIVLLAVSGTWPAQHYPHYFSDFWDIFCERKKYWEKVYFVVDANNMPIQSEEFRGYVQKNWSHLLDREDFRLCIVEFRTMKRAIWKSIYKLLNVQSKIRLFKDHNEALQWVKKDRSVQCSKGSK